MMDFYCPTSIAGWNILPKLGCRYFWAASNPSSLLSEGFQPVMRFFLELIRDCDHFDEPFRGDHLPAFAEPVGNMVPIGAAGVEADRDPA